MLHALVFVHHLHPASMRKKRTLSGLTLPTKQRTTPMNASKHRFIRNTPLTVLLVLMLLLAACADNVEEPGTEVIEPEESVVAEEPVGGYDADYFGDWDLDDDMNLTEDEFSTGIGDHWGAWDTDRDTYLSEDEFNTSFGTYSWYTPALYGDWDADGDDLLSEDEWTTGAFGTWDADGDTYVAENEFDTGLFD